MVHTYLNQQFPFKADDFFPHAVVMLPLFESVTWLARDWSELLNFSNVQYSAATVDVLRALDKSSLEKLVMRIPTLVPVKCFQRSFDLI
jgi:hypothetical protein